MSVKEDGRRTHVRRVYAKDAQGNRDKDVWIDIEVIDELFSRGTGTMVHTKDSTNPVLTKVVAILNDQIRGQGIHYVFNPDGADAQDRETEEKQIENPDDEQQFVKVDITKELKVEMFLEKTIEFWARRWVFKNGESNDNRKVKYRRVIHCDIDEKHLDAEGQPPNDPERYLAVVDKENPDKDQYVEVEVPTRQRFRRSEKLLWMDIVVEYKPGNSKLLERLPSEPAKDTDGIDAPWRLDPLQTIINVSWGAGGLPVEFYEED